MYLCQCCYRKTLAFFLLTWERAGVEDCGVVVAGEQRRQLAVLQVRRVRVGAAVLGGGAVGLRRRLRRLRRLEVALQVLEHDLLQRLLRGGDERRRGRRRQQQQAAHGGGRELERRKGRRQTV